MAFKLKELDGQLGEVLANLTTPKPMVLWKEEHGRYQVWLTKNEFGGRMCKQGSLCFWASPINTKKAN